MNVPVKNLYRDVQESYIRITQLAEEIRVSLDNVNSLEELADTGYAAREMLALTKSIKHKIDQLHVKSQQVLCLRHIEQATGEKIVTSHCTAMPDLRQTVSIPSLKSRPDDYRLLMVDFFGVPEEYCMAYETLRPHYPGVNNLITDLTASGSPLPPGLAPSNVHNNFLVSYRKRKAVLEA